MITAPMTGVSDKNVQPTGFEGLTESDAMGQLYPFPAIRVVRIARDTDKKIGDFQLTAEVAKQLDEDRSAYSLQTVSIPTRFMSGCSSWRRPRIQLPGLWCSARSISHAGGMQFSTASRRRRSTRTQRRIRSGEPATVGSPGWRDWKRSAGHRSFKVRLPESFSSIRRFEHSTHAA